MLSRLSWELLIPYFEPLLGWIVYLRTLPSLADYIEVKALSLDSDNWLEAKFICMFWYEVFAEVRDGGEPAPSSCFWVAKSCFWVDANSFSRTTSSLSLFFVASVFCIEASMTSTLALKSSTLLFNFCLSSLKLAFCFLRLCTYWSFSFLSYSMCSLWIWATMSSVGPPD